MEWTYLFCYFVKECLAPSVVGNWVLTARLRGARSRSWKLRLLGGQGRDTWGDGNEAGMDDWFASLDLTLEPTVDAYQILSRIYALFGIGDHLIPYTTKDGRLDPEALKALR